MIRYALRRLSRAMLTAVALLVAEGLLLSVLDTSCAPGGCAVAPGMLAWLGGALQLDFGRTTSNQPVLGEIAAALPATLLLLVPALLIGLLLGWGGGLAMALADCGEGSSERHGFPRRVAWQVGRGLAALAGVCQALPVFWLGGLLVGVFSVGAGWLPPGGIAGPALPAFGASGYLDALRADPAAVLGDLARHLLLPACTLALAGLATAIRLFRATLPAIWAAPHMRVARSVGLPRRRLPWRAVRPTLPLVAGGCVAGAPLLASALVLVEYLYGWPGLGLLAYHAARAGDTHTLGALVLLFGLAVIVADLLSDLLSALADPRLRGHP